MTGHLPGRNLQFHQLFLYSPARTYVKVSAAIFRTNMTFSLAIKDDASYMVNTILSAGHDLMALGVNAPVVGKESVGIAR